jgi:glycosyltransferase involved in cell wall biosynthesis
MNIIHVPRRFTKSAWGGTENVVLNTAKAQQSIGCNPVVYTSKALDSTTTEHISGVPVHRFDYSYPFLGLSEQQKLSMDQVGGNLLSLPMLHALWKKPAPDLIHLHTGKRLGGIVRTISKLKRIPYVISLHGGLLHVPQKEQQHHVDKSGRQFEWGRIPGALLGARRVIADADAVLCVGEEEKRRVNQMFPNKRVEYLPNGVDSDWFSKGNSSLFRTSFNIPATQKLLLNVGRIDPQKNQMVLIDALSLIHKQRDDVHLVLLGPVTDDLYLVSLKKRIKQLELEGHITIIDGLDQDDPLLRSAYHAADLFCLSSVHEPFGIVILEAWASKCPVLAARVGGIPDFAENGKDIHFVNSNQSNYWCDEIIKNLDHSSYTDRYQLMKIYQDLH